MRLDPANASVFLYASADAESFRRFPHCGHTGRTARKAQALMAIDGSNRNGQKPMDKKPSGTSQISSASHSSQAGSRRGRPLVPQ